MSVIDKPVFTQAVALATIAGVRSMSAPALLAKYASEHKGKFKKTPFNWILSENVQGIAPILALGEMVGDKLPFAPNRISPMLLLGRVGSGALVGAALFASEKEDTLTGAVVGGGAAFFSSFVSFAIRVGVSKVLHLPSPIVGLAEDAAVITLGPKIWQG